MTIYEHEVEVVNVGRITSAADGSLIYQVAFGMIIKPAQGMPIAPGSKELAANTIIIYFKSSKEVPYKVGSKWKLKIADDGQITLNKVK